MTQTNFFTRKQQEIGVALNDAQQEAVITTEGPLLLLASPGSGKTTTVIMRIGYLIEEQGVDPSRIKAVTFSRASAVDMKERYQKFFPSLQPVDFSTIHSLAYKVVRDYFRLTGTAYEFIEGEVSDPKLHKRVILRRLFESINEERITEDQLDELSTYISLVKNKLISKESWESITCNVPGALEILKEYECFKKHGKHVMLLDYDDMLTVANEALELEESLLAKYQNQYDYVLTDESQDTSLVQHAIIEKLVRKHKNLCVVADDDQSIYTWRGADPQYLLNFKNQYPNAFVLYMEQNYRSTKDIVEVANQFIRQNKHRYPKNMFTHNGAHQPIRLQTLSHYEDQCAYLVKQVSLAASYRDVAILYRNNGSSIMLMDAFERAGIPFYIKDSDQRFFNHWIVKDILNFMRLSYDLGRVDIFERIYSKTPTYLSKYDVEQLKRFSSKKPVFDNLQSLDLKDWQKRKLNAFKDVFIKFHQSSPSEVIRLIRRELEYEKVIREMSKRLGFKLDVLLENLDILESIAEHTSDMVSFANRLKHLDRIGKESKFSKNQDAVTLSTLHSSKGLEFPTVYLIDLVNGVIPSTSDLEALRDGQVDNIEEAVRLFYVGMTRAELYLELITYERKFNKKVVTSKFYRDINQIINPSSSNDSSKSLKVKHSTKQVNPNAISSREQIDVGLQVNHRVFGEGEVRDVTDDLMTIQFEQVEKELSIATCLKMGLIEKVK